MRPTTPPPTAPGDELGPDVHPTRRPPAFAGRGVRRLACRMLAAALVLLGLSPSRAPAAEPAAQPPAPVVSPAPTVPALRYRRVFLPSESIRRLESNALGDEAFVPLKREEFERLLGAVGAKSSSPQTASSPQISQAVYTALLNGELLVGSAELTVVPGADPGAVLLLEPCNLVVSKPVWQPAPTAPAAPGAAPAPGGETTAPASAAPAVPSPPSDLQPAGPAAVECGCDDQGRMVAVVNSSGKLQFTWSQRAQRDASGELAFDLQLPLASVKQLRLSLRRDLRPVVEAAVVSALEATADAAEQTWLIEVRGDQAVRLRLVPAAEPPAAQPLTLLRQDQRYSLATDAAEVSIRLRLDVHQQPLTELTLQLDSALQLYRAQYRELPLSWSESVTGTQHRVTLALPEPLLGDGHEIRLQAIAVVNLGTDWRLPRVSVPGVFWLEGVSRLDVAEPLRLARLELRGGRQVQATPLPAPERGESIEIREHQPQAQIVALLQHGGGEAIVQTVTSVKLGTAATTGVVDARLTCSGVPPYQVELSLAAGWTVNQVQTDPPEALENWRAVTGGGQGRSVQIQFRTPLSADRPLPVTLTAQRRGIRPGERLRGRDVRLGTWRNASVTRSLLAVAADPPHQVALSGDIRLKRLASEDLSAWEQQRTQAAAEAIVFLEDAGLDEFEVSLLEETPSYSAEIQIQAAYRPDWAEHEFRLRCQPLASKVARLVLHFSEPLQPPLRWTLSGQEDQAVLARPLGNGENSAPPDSPSQTWELVLPRARDDSFELTTNYAQVFSGTARVPLASVPEAASQVGYVTIQSETLPLTIEPQNVRPIPAEAAAPGCYTVTRGAYRFDPSLDCRLTVHTAPAIPGFDFVWVERAELETRVLDAGQALHTASYRLENRGCARALIEPPADADLLEILVNGRPVFWPRQATRRASVAVDLPRGDRYPTVALRYTTRYQGHGPWAEVTAPWPNLGLLVLEQRWLIWLPPGWQAESPHAVGAGDWPRRLFGPLVRTPSQPRFDPFSAGQWSALWSRAAPPAGGATERWGELALRCLAEEYLARGHAAEDASSLTWGELWLGTQRRLAELLPGGPPALRADATALACAGIGGRTPVETAGRLVPPPAREAADPRVLTRLGAALLEQPQVALVCAGDQLFVTTTQAVALRADRIQRTHLAGVFRAAEAAAWDADAGRADGLQSMPLSVWAALSAAPLASGPRPETGFLNPGWTAVQVPVGSSSGTRRETVDVTRVRIVYGVFFQAAGWAAFLATTGLLVWGTRRRPLWCLPLSALGGALALAVPETWISVASGCFLGSVLAVVLVWLVPGPRRETASPSDTSRGSSRVLPTATAPVLIVAATAFLTAGTATAQPLTPAAPGAPSNAPVREADKVYRVLFPVDDEQQPMEPYVYVPRDFLTSLWRATSGVSAVARQWLISGADYRVIFELDAATLAPQARELAAQYRVRTTRAGSRLQLPIRQDQVYLLPNRARLDGRPASVAWESDGRVLVVEVPEAGEADLELAFRPQVELRDGALRCGIQIPRVPDSRLRLQLPAGVSGVDCLTALGTATSEPTGEQLIALGPADQLVLQWPAKPEPSAGAGVVEADQLMWLRVRPGGAVLEARFRFHPTSGRLQDVGVLAAPRLRLLPHRDPERVPLAPAADGENQRLRWAVQPPSAQDVTLDLEFVVADVTGPGTVRLPRLEALAARTSRRWLAVSVDDTLSYSVPPEALGQVVDPAAFAAAWENGIAPPQLAVAIGDGEPVWNLATQPQARLVKAAQQLEIAWGAERTDLQFQAQIESAGGADFEYRVDVPAGLEIGDASLREQDGVRPARWIRSGDKTVVLRWDRPLPARHQLEVRGWLPAPPAGEHSVPRVSVQGAEVVSDTVQLYRRSAVRVEVLDRGGWTDTPQAPSQQYRPGWGRLVAALQPPPDPSSTSPVRVNVQPNRPRPRGILVTNLERAQDGWQAQLQYELQVTAGVVDAVRWEIPAEWTGPLTCDCPGDLEILAIPGQKRRHLILRPHEALAGPRRLNVSGRLSTPQGETVQAPDIIPLDVEAAERFICTPTQINQQGIAWKTSGLREIAELPAGFAEPSGPHKVFVVTQSHFRATIADVQTPSGQPRVVLADLLVTCNPGGELAGTASFDMQPSGIEGCDLELPEGYQLIDVAVGGLPAMISKTAPGRWRITFGPRQLAHQIQVVFSGHLTGGANGRRQLQRPRLEGVPVEQTLWTIRTPAPGLLQAFPARDVVPPIKLEFVRFAARAGLIDRGSEALAAGDPVIASRWYSGWLRSLAESRRLLEQWSAARPELRAQYAKEFQELQATQAELDERLKTLPQAARGGAEPAAALAPSLQRAGGCVDGPAAVAAVVTRADVVEVEFGPAAAAVAGQRGAAAAVLLALATVAWMLLPSPALHRCRRALLPLAGIALGAVWWTWCTPSVLGLALGLISLLCGLARLVSALLAPSVRPAAAPAGQRPCAP